MLKKMKSDGQHRVHDKTVESMSRADLLQFQLRNLQSLLERVNATNDFYRRRFEKAHFHPGTVRSFEHFFEQAPFLSKQELLEDQQDFPPYGRRLQIPRSKIAYPCLTSGTTGIGQEVHPYSLPDIESLSNSWAFMFRWGGIEPGDRAFTCLPLSIQIGGQSIMRAFERYGLETFPVAALDGKTKLQLMKRFPPHYVVIVPAYLIRLTVLCEELGINPRRDFPDLKNITVVTQGYSVAWAREMEETWGAPLSETYASTQAAPAVMTTCEHGVLRDGSRRGIIHALESKLLFEVLDRETGQHVQPGESGELVVTTLTREATPLIRYRMDDRVTYLGPDSCDCGRPFAGIEAGTVARYDDMLKIKGTNIWPEAVDAVIFAHPELDEYNARVLIDERGRERVLVQIEFRATTKMDAEGARRLIAQIATELRDRVGVSMELQQAPRGSLERFDYKARRWTDERRQGRQVVKYHAE